MINKKEFKVDGKDYYVVRPTSETIKNADRYRAKTWNQCISDGVLTKKELAKILKDRGIWSEQRDEEQQTIIKAIQDMEKELYLGTGKTKSKLSDGQKIAIEMRKLRLKLRVLMAERLSMEENTAEALAENAKFDYFVADCTFSSDGKKVYNGVEDYLGKAADELAYTAGANLGEILYQIDAKGDESLPENQWLKKFNLVNEEMDLVNREGVLVDEEGRRINEQGHFLDENGNRIDKYGNPLNEDGSYVIKVEYEDDLSPKLEVTPRPPRKKVTDSTAG